MGTVIGPIAKEDWEAMVNSRGTLRFWKQDAARYARAIEKTENFYNRKLRSYADMAAA